MNLKDYDKHWIQWTKKELILKGIEIDVPSMPESWAPNYEAYKKEIEKYKIDENTILIGHSCGCAFLVRWLGDTKKKILKLILVAPWKIPIKGDKIRELFYNYTIDRTIKERVDEIIMFTSDNEKEEGKESLKIFNKELGGKIINLPEKGHYTFKDMETGKLPELLEEILKIKDFTNKSSE